MYNGTGYGEATTRSVVYSSNLPKPTKILRVSTVKTRMTKQDKSDKGKGAALRPEADERIATPSTSSSTPLAPTQEDVIMDPQGTRETEQRETALTGERPNDRPKNDCNQEPASYNVFPAQSSSSRTAAPPPTTFNPSAPNPFQSRTAAETYGFMSAAESRALTNTNTTASSPPPRQPIFRPLAPNEFLFDPALSPRRRAAIVGGWVASDGSEAPEPEVVNQEMEPGGVRSYQRKEEPGDDADMGAADWVL
ncbi:hypothetical protein HBH56_118190 [Parastagonospora nodorum]|nr:hypothetical protein HBH56_118190 [Parastagonospora nodorum]KAH4136479.1 hypothetical protein HBH45_133940 [Parastagonospora nodorum]KAH5015104.1 hypothetical protein HBI74_178770 [Parastagonospora nodorum]KAH5155535.1 hypothetical protein HBH69_100640 [Parastagonospora nodorum]KAH5553253.1 hypothetical protein HBI25_174820 [Parastagonospora nodorum]